MHRLARLAVATLVAGAALTAPASAAAPLVRAKADVGVQGPAIPRSFLGFSQEVAEVHREVGPMMRDVNGVLVQLYRNLTTPGAGPPVFRIGGGSQDATYFNPGDVMKPKYINNAYTPNYFKSVARFLAATGSKVIVGLNMASNDPQLAADEVRGVLDNIPRRRILSLELGNEPDLYPIREAGRDADGKIIYSRSKRYRHSHYLRELDAHLDAIEAAGARRLVAAPGAGAGEWLDELPVNLRRFARRLNLVTLHSYALSACKQEPGDRGYPSVPILLQQDVFLSPVKAMQRGARFAARHRLPLRITETNTVACGGVENVSDAFGSALWGADWMFGLAAVGVDGVNFHEASQWYQPFASVLTENGTYLAAVKPLYYAMLMFSEAATHGGRLLPSTYLGARPRAGANVKVWGVVDKVDRVVRVVVIHKGGSAGGGVVDIEVPRSLGKATLKRLRAPSGRATSGVTWAGQGFTLPTRDGKLVGRLSREGVRRRKGGHFRFHLPRMSAALLTVRVSSTRARRIVKP